MFKNFIDDMVPEFGYDYVIGYCLCSEYDAKKNAELTEDEDKKRRMLNRAKMMRRKAEALMKERIADGL